MADIFYSPPATIYFEYNQDFYGKGVIIFETVTKHLYAFGKNEIGDISEPKAATCILIRTV